MPFEPHNRLVMKAVEEMRRQHVTQIHACLPNHLQPSIIGKYIPDVTGVHTGRPIIS